MRLGILQTFFIAALFAVAVVNAAAPAVADDVGDCADQSGEKAIAACTRAITSGKFRGKSLAELFYNRGVTRADEGQVDLAIADYSEAIRLDPKDGDAVFNRGRVYSERKDHDRAIADYTTSIKLDGSRADAFNNRGRAWQEKGDTARALSDFTQAIKLNPQHVRAYENRADVFFKLARYQEALDGYETALKLDSSRVWSLYGRGMAKLKRGDVIGGKADIDAANMKDEDIAKEFAKEQDVK